MPTRGCVLDTSPTWTSTGTKQDPQFSPPTDGGIGQNQLSGTFFTVNQGADPTGTPITVPGTDANLRFWRNTAIAKLASNQSITVGDQVLGYEWDVDADNGFRPPAYFRCRWPPTISLPTISSITAPPMVRERQRTIATLYRAASKALVFGAGTVQWSRGLDNTHDTYCGSGPYVTDPNMQQATVNLFADMGVQPATLQAGLLAASASADTTPPRVHSSLRRLPEPTSRASVTIQGNGCR